MRMNWRRFLEGILNALTRIPIAIPDIVRAQIRIILDKKCTYSFHYY